LHEERLAAGVLEDGGGDFTRDGVAGEFLGGLAEESDGGRLVEIGEADLAGADEVVIPDAVEVTERRGAGDEDADAAAVLDGGAEEAHELEELGATAGEEVLQAFGFVNAEEYAAVVGKVIQLFQPFFGGFHGRAFGEGRDFDAPVAFGLEDGLFGELLPERGDAGDGVGLEVKEYANGVREHLGKHFQQRRFSTAAGGEELYGSGTRGVGEDVFDFAGCGLAAAEDFGAFFVGERVAGSEWVGDEAGGGGCGFSDAFLEIRLECLKWGVEVGRAVYSQLIVDGVELDAESFQVFECVTGAEGCLRGGGVACCFGESQKNWISALGAGKPRAAKFGDGFEVSILRELTQLVRA